MSEASAPYTVRWGILSCGRISGVFARDLLLDPGTRGVTDIKHEITAASTQDSASRAQKFLDDLHVPSSAKAYGSYVDLLKDPAVDIVYIGTPHSHHYQHARAALEAGKHVLCEKPMTVNAAQTKILVDLAIQKGLFLMEAVWTRYMPLVQEVTKIVQDGKLGTVWRVFADLSGYHDLDGDLWDGTRLVELDLAGGAMLDLGIYSITWIFQILYHINAAAQSHTPIVASSMSKYAKTGSDESTSMLITFPPTNTVGIATTHLRVSDNPDNVETAGTPIRIQGSKGEIQVYGPAFRPERYRIIPAAGNEHGELKGGEVKHEIEGRGMYWEADECARCLRDGRKESEGMGWAESLAVMGVMDQAREQNGLKYPDRIESVEYPLEGFGL